MMKTVLHDSEASTDITSISESPVQHPTLMANFWIERLPFGVKISCDSPYTVSNTDSGEILIEARVDDNEPTIPGPGWGKIENQD